MHIKRIPCLAHMQKSSHPYNESLRMCLGHMQQEYPSAKDSTLSVLIRDIYYFLHKAHETEPAINALEIEASLLIQSFRIVNPLENLYRPFAYLREQGRFPCTLFHFVQPLELPLRRQQFPFGIEFVQNSDGIFCIADRDTLQPWEILDKPKRFVLSLTEIVSLTLGYAESNDFHASVRQ